MLKLPYLPKIQALSYLGFNRLSTSILGIDISSRAVKLVQLEKQGQAYHVTASGAEALPLGALQNGTVVNETAVIKVLKHVYDTSGATSKNAAIAVSGSSVLSKIVDLPARMNQKQLAARIQLAASESMPLSLEEIYLDYAVLGYDPNDQHQMRVKMVACPRTHANSREKIVEGANLRSVAIDIESYALVRSYQKLSASSIPNESMAIDDSPFEVLNALIDVGANSFTFAVFKSDLVVYTSEYSLGKTSLEDKNISPRQIEKKENNKDFYSKTSLSDYDNSDLQAFIGLLLQYTNRSLADFYNANASVKIQKLIFSGGMFEIAGLAEKLDEQIDIPTEIFSSNDYLTETHAGRLHFLSQNHSMTVALGLALRSHC
ncbi:MAG: type IV pilus assembly protein PilM [Porticoccaceae bacterium]|nr:type IV pilus assembly protein PilM [Porticoccaceae bacterium]